MENNIENIDVNVNLLEELEKLVQMYPENESLAAHYAKTLHYSTFNKDWEYIKEAEEKLALVYEEHKDCYEVAVEYAKLLLDLTVDTDYQQAYEAVTKINYIYMLNEEDYLISLLYAKSLCNMVQYETKEIEIRDTLRRIKKLADYHYEYLEFKTVYANVLEDLIKKGLCDSEFLYSECQCVYKNLMKTLEFEG